MEFLKSNKRFSFKLDDVDAWKLAYNVKYNEEGDTLVSE